MLVHLMSHNESELNANEEQRPNSSVQLLDPLLRRRISGWNIKPQILDPQNQFYDLGRVIGLQRLNMKSRCPNILYVVI